MLKNTKKIITSKSVITFYPEKHGMNFCHKKYKIDAMFKNTKIIITSKSVTTFTLKNTILILQNNGLKTTILR